MFLFDTRALQGTQPTGVNNYIRQLAKHILQTNIGNEITFLTTGLHTQHTTPTDQTRSVIFPNKLLNLSIALRKQPTLTRLADMHPSTPRLIPNINFVAPNKTSPYILTIHDLSFLHTPHWYSQKMQLWHKATQPLKLIKHANHIIAVSEATKNDCIQTCNIPEERISVVYPGITPPTRTHSKRLIKKRYILCMGAIEPRKNLDVLFHAFARLKKNPQHKDLQLIIAGPLGCKGRRIINTTKKLNISASTTYLGYVTQQAKNNLLEHAEIFVYPALFEGFGFPPLEAMIRNTPVIASWTTSLKEVLGTHALLTHPHKPDDITTAMETLLTDKAFTHQLTSDAYQHATTFTWQRCAQQTAHILKNITTNNPTL